MSPMAFLRLTFLVAFYLALDLANPMMPGALVFSAEDSVEAHSARRRVVEVVTPASAPVFERRKPNPHRLVAFLPAVSTWRTPAIRAARPRLPSDDPSASTEDD